MLLNILTWNINYIHDNLSERLKNINKILDSEIEQCDIIVLQEAIIPFTNTLHNIYNFLKFNPTYYFAHRDLFEEEKKIYSVIKKYFPTKFHTITRIFEYGMDKLLLVCSYIFSRYGMLLQKIYT